MVAAVSVPNRERIIIVTHKGFEPLQYRSKCADTKKVATFGVATFSCLVCSYLLSSNSASSCFASAIAAAAAARAAANLSALERRADVWAFACSFAF